MFYSITGTVVHVEPAAVAIDVQGVAFHCRTSMNTIKNLAQNKKATLYTYLNVREDALDLYGFSTETELRCFKMLTAISGLGPKAGISILSVLTAEEISLAAAAGDAKQFARANGVGPKLAQRIVLELKDKFKDFVFSESGQGNTGPISVTGNATQAVTALASLGYSPSEAAFAVGKLDSTLPVEELIRLALRSFAG